MVKRWIAMGDLANIADDTDCILAPDNTILVLAADYDALEAKYARLVKFIEEARYALNKPYDFPLAPPTGEG